MRKHSGIGVREIAKKLNLNISYGVDVISTIKEIISQIEPIAIAHNINVNFKCSKINLIFRSS